MVLKKQVIIAMTCNAPNPTEIYKHTHKHTHTKLETKEKKWAK